MNIKTAILAFVLFSNTMAYGQIKSIVPVEKQSVVVSEFDSTKFYWTDNIHTLIGQVIIGNCSDFDLKRGYIDKTMYTKDNFIDKYRYMSYGKPLYGYTKCEAIQGKTFTIIDYKKDLWSYVKIEDKNSGETFWYKWSGLMEPFIIESHLNYLKTRCIGEKYVPICRNIPLVAEKTFYVNDTDIKTGEKIDYNIDDIWECIDIAQIKGKSDLVAVLKNNRGNTSYVSVGSIFYHVIYGKTWKNFLTQSEYLHYVDKYGLIETQALQKGIIVQGMHKESLLIVYGEPDQINRNSYSDAQYVYELSERYFGSDYEYHRRKVMRFFYIDENTGLINAWN